MSVKIDNVRPANDKEWDNIWNKSRCVSYGSSREWAEQWSIYTRGRVYPTAQIIHFSDGKTVLLPLSIRKYNEQQFNKYILSAGFSYGGWLSTDNIDRDHEELLTDYLIRNMENILWLVNPFQEISTINEIAAKAAACETRVLYLADGFEPIYKIWKKGSIERKARKARKAGIEVKVASGRDEWGEFFEVVYKQTLERWGDNAGMVLNENLKNLKQTPHVHLWLALHSKKIIAGCILCYGNSIVEYATSAALHEYFNLRPMNLILFEAVKDCCEKGYAWFDFGSSHNRHGKIEKGVLDFKKSFNAKEIPLYIVDIETASTTASC
ncbi:MAG: GNAT family N-acetyltransferase [Desulfobacterales bacterium]|nr:GNAT family N-acetyltransferase [Desulfobacterales bacterium]